MAKQKRASEHGAAGANTLDRLRLRVSTMINSPKAQADRRATIWRLDSDTDQAWSQVMEELAETDGLDMTRNEDGTVLLQWQPGEEEGEGVQGEGEELPADFKVQTLHDQPAPF